MKLLKSLVFAAVLAFATPTLTYTAETTEVKIELAELPAVVKEGFTSEVPNGELKSAKKLTGNSTRYQLKYKLDGKEHQITIGEDGKPTRKKKS